MGSEFSGIAAWDRGMFEVVNKSMANGFLDALLPLCSDVSIWLVPLAILWVFYFIRSNRTGRLIAIGCFVVLAATDQISDNLLKPMVHRNRPCNVVPSTHYYDDQGNWLITDKFGLTTYKHSFGFPSNHAANIAGQAMYWSYFFPHLTPVMILVAGAVGFSRVYLGHHYPADVFAGYVVGIVLALIIAWMLRRWIIPESRE
jgi:undecaprenyl-diphosphatase